MMKENELYLRGYRLTTLRIYYYMPDHASLIQEFLWQTLDLPPEFRRVHKFLNYWKSNIIVPIKEIELSYNSSINNKTIKTIDNLYDLN